MRWYNSSTWLDYVILSFFKWCHQTLSSFEFHILEVQSMGFCDFSQKELLIVFNSNVRSSISYLTKDYSWNVSIFDFEMKKNFNSKTATIYFLTATWFACILNEAANNSSIYLFIKHLQLSLTRYRLLNEGRILRLKFVLFAYTTSI